MGVLRPASKDAGISAGTDGTPIGHVGDALKVNVSNAATSNFEKTEDAAHNTGDAGAFILGVRNDGNAVRTDANGDYSPISTDSTGRMKVNVAGQEVRLGMDVQSQLKALIDAKVLSAATTSMAYEGAAVDVSDFAFLLPYGFYNVTASGGAVTADTIDVEVWQSSDGTNFDIKDVVTFTKNGNRAAPTPIPIVGTHAKLKIPASGTPGAGTLTTTCRFYLYARVI